MRQAPLQEGTPVIPVRHSVMSSVPRCHCVSTGRFQSVAQFVEWRLRRAWRNRRRAAAGAAARSATRSGTASCAITAGVRASDDVAEVRRHFLDAEHARRRRLRRFRRAALSRRLHLTVRRRQLCRGGRCGEGECRNERKLVHDRARLAHRGQPARWAVCSATAMPSLRFPNTTTSVLAARVKL